MTDNLRIFRLFRRPLAALTLAATAIAYAAPGHATVIYTFDLPAVSTSAIGTKTFPTLATLSLDQDGADVVFIFDPDETNNSYTLPPNSGVSQIKHLDMVFGGISLPSLLHISGPMFTMTYDTNNLDSGYSSTSANLRLVFDPGFTANLTSSWRILNTNLITFTGSFATANSKPSPTFGTMSVAPYVVNPKVTPTPSNWVSGAATQIPSPGTLALLGAGFFGLGISRRALRRGRSGS